MEDQIKQVKLLLSSLIISSASGLTVRRLAYDYRNEIGEDVPYRKFGFNSFEQFLSSIPETCRLNGYGDQALVIPVVNEKTKHINDMILKQKAPKSKARFQPPRRARGVYTNSPAPSTSASTSHYNHKPLNPPPPAQKPFKLPISNPDSHKLVIPPPHDYFLENLVNKKPATKSKPTHTVPQVSVASTSINSKPLESQRDTRLSDNTCETARRFNNSYESDIYDECFDDEYFYYKSDEEELVETCSRELQTLVVGEQKPCAEESPVIHESRVNDNIKKKLLILISENPDGIWCSKLPKMFAERFHQNLEPLDYGFTSMIQLCDDLPDVFHCIRPNRMDWKLYDKRKPIPDIHTISNFSKYLETLPYARNTENTEPAIPDSFTHVTQSYCYPDNVLTPNDTIPRQWLVDEKPTDYIELIISEVYDPSKFWIQLRGVNTSVALNKLMDDMQLFYMHNAGKLQLNEFSVQIGLPCAALFMNEYHRAIVIKVFEDQTLKVFYMDYGTVAEVQLRKTCLLHKDFSELPQQAVRARLANIIPKEPNTMWPRAASQLMLQLVMEKDLIAYINAIYDEQQVLDLIVTDTTLPDVDVHINDVLIEQGYAVLGTEAPICSTSSAIVPNVHLYPAFEEIENGIYPSVSDVVRLLKLGQTYETIFHGYFSHSSCSLYSPDSFNLNHSRCSTSFDGPFSPNFIEYTTQDHSTPVEQVIEEVEEQESQYDDDDEYHYQSLESEESKEESESPEVASEELLQKEKSTEEIGFNENIPEQTETQVKEPEKEEITKSNPPFVKKPPPGFEHVKPQTNPIPQMPQKPMNYNQYPTYPQYTQYQNTTYYPSTNTYSQVPYQNFQYPMPTYYNNVNSFNSFANDLYLYNQILWQQQQQQQQQQQREYFNRTVLHCQNVDFALKFASAKQNLNAPSSTKTDIKLTETNASAVNTSVDEEKSTKTKDNIETTLGEQRLQEDCPRERKSLSTVSEHICERFVLQLKIGNSTLHVLKLDEAFYVVTQEIITNLFNSEVTLKTWLKSKDLDTYTFPNKLINIMLYENVYRDLKNYTIPGVPPPNNLGCNIRLTPLEEIVNIVQNYGDHSILPDLKSTIKHLGGAPYLWKLLDQTD